MRIHRSSPQTYLCCVREVWGFRRAITPGGAEDDDPPGGPHGPVLRGHQPRHPGVCACGGGGRGEGGARTLVGKRGRGESTNSWTEGLPRNCLTPIRIFAHGEVDGELLCPPIFSPRCACGGEGGAQTRAGRRRGFPPSPLSDSALKRKKGGGEAGRRTLSPTPPPSCQTLLKGSGRVCAKGKGMVGWVCVCVGIR